MKKGYFIVIDGANGSGKATQSKLLVDLLKKKKIPVLYFDFPRYYSSFFGKIFGRYLTGEFGTLETVSPYLASILTAQDRNLAKDSMYAFLERKIGLLVANRYVSSNLALQGANLKHEKEQNAFFKWIDELEYKVNGIPKEDLLIYLHVPISYADRLIKRKEARKYINGKSHDIHEINQTYLKRAEKIYLSLAKKRGWTVIKCIEKGKLLSIDAIHEMILAVLREKKIITI